VGEDQHVDEVLREIRAELLQMNQLRRGDALLRGDGQHDLKSDYADERLGSRYVGPDADESLVDHVSKGGTIRTAKRPGQRFETKGLGALMTKALSEGTGAAGGYLVPQQVAAEVMTMLRARSAVARLGPKVVPVARTLAVTSISTGASAYYVAENAAIPVSEQTFAQTPLLTPKELAALVPVSNRLLHDAAISPAVEQVLRQDLAEIMALRQDLAFIQGTGTGGEPLGIIHTGGLTPAPSLGPDGGIPDFDDLKTLVGTLRLQNAPFLQPGWIFNPVILGTLEKLKDSTGRYLADAGLLTFDPTGGGGTLLGYPFATTTQIPTNLTVGENSDTTYVIFGSDWASEAWIGENEALTIEASPTATYTPDGGTTWVSAWQNRQTVFRAVIVHDFALRRPQLFSVMSGVRSLS
jgi:HK97 family phage major capsid protein